MANEVNLSFFCPLVGQIVDEDNEFDEYEEVSGAFLAGYEDQIKEAIARDQSPERCGEMTQYFDEDESIKDKLLSIVWTAEEFEGKLYGRIDCKFTSALTEDEIDILKDWVCGQNSDGLGEGFEQRPIHTDEGDIYVSYWNSDYDYSVMTQDEFDEYIENMHGMQMGGM